MFSLEKRGFGDDSGDSFARLTEMFVGSKAAHKTMNSTGAAPAGMVAKGKWHRIASLGAQVHSRTIEIDLRHSERRHDDHQRNR
jgi:hypothetical protein